MALHKKVYIANDCSRYGHFGCTLVMETFREQLARVGLDETLTPDDADLVIVNGEGSLHHGRRQDLLDWPARKPSVFVNAVYDTNPEYPQMREFRYVAVRESLSAAALREQGVECDIVPDVVLTSSRLRWLTEMRQFVKPSGVLLTDNVLSGAAGESACAEPTEYVKNLARHERAVCGRFHAALACAVLGVPFSTWDSNTHKIEGLMIDAGVPELHAADQETAIALCPDVMSASVAEYVRDGRERVDSMFEKIAELITN